MSSKSIEELEEALAIGDLALTQFNTRISNASLTKFNYIMGMLQLNSIGRVTKQNAIEYIIKEQFAIMNEQPKKKSISIGDKVANGESI